MVPMAAEAAAGEARRVEGGAISCSTGGGGAGSATEKGAEGDQEGSPGSRPEKGEDQIDEGGPRLGHDESPLAAQGVGDPAR